MLHPYWAAPFTGTLAGKSFPSKHCEIYDESPITPPVSYNPTPPYVELTMVVFVL